jgi:hypothetical protein
MCVTSDVLHSFGMSVPYNCFYNLITFRTILCFSVWSLHQFFLLDVFLLQLSKFVLWHVHIFSECFWWRCTVIAIFWGIIHCFLSHLHNDSCGYVFLFLCTHNCGNRPNFWNIVFYKRNLRYIQKLTLKLKCTHLFYHSMTVLQADVKLSFWNPQQLLCCINLVCFHIIYFTFQGALNREELQGGICCEQRICLLCGVLCLATDCWAGCVGSCIVMIFHFSRLLLSWPYTTYCITELCEYL